MSQLENERGGGGGGGEEGKFYNEKTFHPTNLLSK